ncbi:MAG TPA: hypothetical protein DCZ56_02535 [Sutterella sp.]|nr:hypothetical protein [Sutterella sp.]
MEVQELIEGLCRKVGIPGELFEDGTLPFEIDGREVAIHAIAEVNSAVLIGSLGEPGPGSRVELYRKMLLEEHLLEKTLGASFSIDPQTGSFVLSRTLSCEGLTVDEFIAAAEQFITQLQHWAEVIRDYAPSPKDRTEDLNAAEYGAMRV